MMREHSRLACRWMAVSVILVTSTFAMPPQSERQTRPYTELSDGDTQKLHAATANAHSVSHQAEANERSSTSFSGLGGNFLQDQKDIWTSPAHIRFSDTEWLVPLGGLTAGLLETDRQFSGHLSRDLARQRHYRTMANAGTAALVGVGGGLALWSTITHNAHQRETGFLAGEAAVNSLIVAEALKYGTGRQRPFEGNGAGDFFHGGASFPSLHAATAWSVAGVIAHEYPGPLPKLFAYGLASAVTVSRVRSRDHFPSDVLIGSAIGWLMSQHVYGKHHNPELGGSEWNSWSAITRSVEASAPQYLGSPYVPLDSWVYPALDRLAALGLVDSGFAGMRPWTRRECARLVGEATDQLSGGNAENPQAGQLVEALQREFRPETDELSGAGGGTFRIESLYSRTEHISGPPLTDGYHFAQTQINDFGRPYGEGWSTVNGFSAYATQGAWVGYVRGEWQTAPSVPTLPLSARQTVQQVDFLPYLPPDTPKPAVSRGRLLDAYLGLMVSNWQVTFGRQSLSWGPGDGGSMTLSNNAQPINMFRITRTTPLQLPSILGWLGPVRTEFFLGQLSGSQFIFNPSGFVGQFGHSLDPQPFIHGQKLSFKPTRNFEFGFFRTTIYGGPGFPFTTHTFLRSLLSTGNRVAGSPDKPGKRTSGLDFSYRVPGLRNWLTFYADGLAYDQFSPIAYADRSIWRAGLYFPQFPRLHRLDLRIEGVYSDNPLGGEIGSGFFYFNGTWRDGYRNNGNLMGSWIGRAGQGAQAWSNYWFGARNRIQLNFRHQKVSQEFSPGGGTLTDVGLRGDYWLRPNLGISARMQVEQWIFPVIRPNASRNATASVEILFRPQKLIQRSLGHGEIQTLTGDPQ